MYLSQPIQPAVNTNEFKIYRLVGALDFTSAEKLISGFCRADTIILDFAGVPYIDCIGRNALKQCLLQYDTVAICSVSDDTYTCLDLGEILEMENVEIYPTVMDALSMLNSIAASSTTSSGISNSSFSE